MEKDFSYSLYIWHQLVFLFWPAFAGWFLAVPAAFALAGSSYFLLEKPLFVLRGRLREPPKALSFPSAFR